MVLVQSLKKLVIVLQKHCREGVARQQDQILAEKNEKKEKVLVPLDVQYVQSLHDKCQAHVTCHLGFSAWVYQKCTIMYIISVNV